MVASTSLPKRHLPLGVTMYHCSALAAEITHITATAVMLRNLYIGSFLPTRATSFKSSLAYDRKVGYCRAHPLDNLGQIIDLVIRWSFRQSPLPCRPPRAIFTPASRKALGESVAELTDMLRAERMLSRPDAPPFDRVVRRVTGLVAQKWPRIEALAD